MTTIGKLAGLAVLVCALLVPEPAAALSLSVQPGIIRVSVAADGAWSGELALTNLAPEALVVGIGTMNLAPPVREGAPAVPLADKTLREREASLAGWISHPSSVRLDAGATVKVPFTIAVPGYAAAGRHYAALSFTPPGGNAAPTLTVGIALDVVGQDGRSLALAGFPLRRLFTEFPASVAVRLRNTGVTVTPVSGRLTVTDMLRRRSGESVLPAQGEERYLIPGSTAEYAISPGGSGWGIYRANLSVAAGTGTIEEQRYFAVFPWPVAIALGVAALLVVAGAGLSARTLRRRLSTRA